MIKILVLFCFLMGVYCEAKYKCIEYAGKLADLKIDTAKRCEGFRCWRFHHKGEPEIVALRCLDKMQSVQSHEDEMKNIRNDLGKTHKELATAKEEEMEFKTCAGDLCNKDDKAVNDVPFKCHNDSMGEWSQIYLGGSPCIAGRCIQTLVGEKILLGCTDDLECSGKEIDALTKNTISRFQAMTGFKVEKEDVKTTCCSGDLCNTPNKEQHHEVTCYNTTVKWAETRELFDRIERITCNGEVCRYSVGGEKAVFGCASKLSCKPKHLEQAKKNVFNEGLYWKNPSLKSASDVETSCCATNLCNIVDKPAVKSFAVTCHNYAGKTSALNLDNTCRGESCATIKFGERTVLTCFPKMFCEPDWIEKRKKMVVEARAKYGEEYKEEDISVTCCDQDKCNDPNPKKIEETTRKPTVPDHTGAPENTTMDASTDTEATTSSSPLSRLSHLISLTIAFCSFK